MTLWELVERRAHDAPQATAILFADSRISNHEFRSRALSLARGLAGLGIGRGDVVAVQLPNIPEYLLSYAAICALGATLQPVHMPYRRAELAHLLGHSEAKVFVCLSRFKETSPAKEAPKIGHVVALGDAVDGTIAFSALAAKAPLERVPEGSPEERFLLLYTSGTTDNPKGVPHAQRGFLANARVSVTELEITADEILLSAAPLTHLYGLFVYHLSLCSGAAMSLLPAFTPVELASLVEKHRANCVFAGPAHFKPLLDTGLIDRHDFSAMRFACLSGSPVPPELARALEAKLSGKGKTIQLWGMTELQAGSFSRPRDAAEVRHATAGAATPGTELRVVDERLQVRGVSLFAEYFKNPRATVEAFTPDGWFETGDTAELDAGGHLRFTGRVKEIINRGGVKYSPLDIETIIDRMPGVARSAIVPYPDPVLGERACVFVQAAPGAPAATLEAIMSELDRAGVAKFKWPERLELIDTMPLTPTQKVMRGRLREKLREK